MRRYIKGIIPNVKKVLELIEEETRKGITPYGNNFNLYSVNKFSFRCFNVKSVKVTQTLIAAFVGITGVEI